MHILTCPNCSTRLEVEVTAEEAGERPVQCVSCGALVHWHMAEEKTSATPPPIDPSETVVMEAGAMVDEYQRPLQEAEELKMRTEESAVQFVDADETMDGESQAFPVDEEMLLAEVKEFRTKKTDTKSASTSPSARPVRTRRYSVLWAGIALLALGVGLWAGGLQSNDSGSVGNGESQAVGLLASGQSSGSEGAAKGSEKQALPAQMDESSRGKMKVEKSGGSEQKPPVEESAPKAEPPTDQTASGTSGESASPGAKPIQENGEAQPSTVAGVDEKKVGQKKASLQPAKTVPTQKNSEPASPSSKSNAKGNTSKKKGKSSATGGKKMVQTAVLNKPLPKTYDGLMRRGRDCMKLKSKEGYMRALEAFQKASKLSSSVEPREKVAEAYSRLGKHEKAVAKYKEVTSSNPKFRSAQIGLARAYKRAGQKAAAKAAYRTYLNRFPDGTQRAEALRGAAGN